MTTEFGNTFLPRFEMYYNIICEYAEIAPKDKWDFRPGRKSPTLIDLLLEALLTGHSFLNAIESGKVGHSLETARVRATVPTDTDALLAEFHMQHDMLGAVLSALDEDALQKPVKHPIGWTGTLQEMLEFWRENLIHIGGQLTVYFRLLGLEVPEVTDIAPMIGQTA